MHKQPHRSIEKIADNRYWQNQPRLDDRKEFGTPKDLELEDWEPPSLAAPEPEED